MPPRIQEPPSCRNCAGGLHPSRPCPGRDFDVKPRCPPPWRWAPASYLEMAGVKPTPEYVAEVIRQWRASKEADP